MNHGRFCGCGVFRVEEVGGGVGCLVTAEAAKGDDDEQKGEFCLRTGTGGAAIVGIVRVQQLPTVPSSRCPILCMYVRDVVV